VKDSLSQVSYSTKYMTDSVKTLCTQIYFESDISKLHSFASIDLLDESNALRKLRSYKSTTPFIHSIYIYNGKINALYKDFGTRSEGKEIFFDKGIIEIIGNYRKYEKLTPIARKIGENIPLPEATAVSDVYTYLFYQVPQNDNELDSALIINVTVQWIQDIMKSLDENTANNTLIIDNNGLLINGSLEADMLTDMSDINHIKRVLESHTSSGYFVDYVKGSKSLVIYVSSDTTSWKFIRTVPYENIVKRIDGMKKTTVVIALVILILGILLSFVISYRLYKPYNILGTRIKKLESEMQSNRLTLKQGFLRNILYNRSEYLVDTIKSKFSQLDINLDTNIPLILMLLKIDNYTEFCGEYSVNDRSIIKFGIMNISTELIQKSYKNVTVDMLEDHIVLFLNTDKYVNISNLAEEIQSNVEKQFHISLSVAVSSSGSIEEIHDLYSQLLDTKHYFIQKGYHCILYYDDIKGLNSTGYRYPIEFENKLANAIVMGKFVEIKRLFKEVLNDTLAFNYNIFYTTLTRIALAVNTLIDTLKQNSNIQLDFNFNSFISKVSKLETVETIECAYFDLFDQIIGKIQQKNNSKYDDLIKKIQDFIDNNYMDQNLSTDTIADEVNMSAIYLGRLYKKLTSKSLSKVITETRIKRSKELLLNTKFPVSKIVEKSGFVSTAYFYPLFKKLTGTTPNDYRKNASAD
jgi:two-component system, response regulator YesN